MRYLLINVKTLCYGCHFHFWHKHPIAAAAWLKTVLPASRLRKLKEMANTVLPPHDYEKIKKNLEREIAKYRKPGFWRIILRPFIH